MRGGDKGSLLAAHLFCVVSSILVSLQANVA